MDKTPSDYNSLENKPRRPFIVRDIAAIQPQAVVDKSLPPEEDNSPDNSPPKNAPVPRYAQERADNVVDFGGVTFHDIPVEQILQNATDEGLHDVIVVGVTNAGEEYITTSMADISQIVFQLTRALHRLQSICDARFQWKSNVAD